MRSTPWIKVTTRHAVILVLVVTMIAVVSGFGIRPASAATVFNVDTTNDTNLLNPSLTSCIDTGFVCSLRAATQAADNLGGAVTINVPANTYNLTLHTALIVGNQ